jgi:hypothetical protein
MQALDKLKIETIIDAQSSIIKTEIDELQLNKNLHEKLYPLFKRFARFNANFSYSLAFNWDNINKKYKSRPDFRLDLQIRPRSSKFIPTEDCNFINNNYFYGKNDVDRKRGADLMLKVVSIVEDLIKKEDYKKDVSLYLEASNLINKKLTKRDKIKIFFGFGKTNGLIINASLGLF